MNQLCKAFIDTSPIIYHVEGNLQYGKSIELLFNLVDDEKIRVVISSTVLSECLVLPFRKQEDDLVATYLELLLDSEQVIRVDINSEVALKAAKLRADNPSLKYPDASNLAAAMYEKCDYFITNDQSLKKITGLDNLKVIILEDVEQHLSSI